MSVTFKSRKEILETMINKLLVDTGLTDLNEGSVLLTLLEAAADSDFAQEGRLVEILASLSINNLIGVDLDAKASEYGITRQGARKASGYVTITDESFTKSSAKLSPLAKYPHIAGATTLYLDRGISNLAISSNVYVGRGTNNEEVAQVESFTSHPAYYAVALSAPLQNDHSAGESVILGQGGDRVIPAGSTILTGNNEKIEYEVINKVTLKDGEHKLDNVKTIAKVAGTSGNVPRFAIANFSSAPFNGATVTNEASFTNGIDVETDASLRARIKDAIHSLSRGTRDAVLNAIIGLRDDVQNESITAAVPFESTDGHIIYLDNGFGMEPSIVSSGYYNFTDNANGGEQFFRFPYTPIARPTIVSERAEPFYLYNSSLSVKIDDNVINIDFLEKDFKDINNVRAADIVRMINAHPGISKYLVATTYGDRKHVALYSASPETGYIQVLGSSANDAFKFSTSRTYGMALFKNGECLSNKNTRAVILTNSIDKWELNNNLKLQLSTRSSITEVVISETALNKYGTSLVDLSIYSLARFLDDALTGVAVTVTGDRLLFKSEIEGELARLDIGDEDTFLASTGVYMHERRGSSKAFSFNSSTGEIKLETPLIKEDSLSIGYVGSSAYIDTIEADSFILSSDGSLVLSTDRNSKIIPTAYPNGKIGGTLMIDANSPGYVKLSGSKVNGPFSGVNQGDWIAFSYNGQASQIFEVSDIDVDGKYIRFKASGWTTDPVTDYELVVFRSDNFRRINIPAGTYSAIQLANALNEWGFTATPISNKVRIRANPPASELTVIHSFGGAIALGLDEKSREHVLSATAIAVSRQDVGDAGFENSWDTANVESSSESNELITIQGSHVATSGSPNYNRDIMDGIIKFLDENNNGRTKLINGYTSDTLVINSNIRSLYGPISGRYSVFPTFQFGYNDTLNITIESDTIERDSVKLPISGSFVEVLDKTIKPNSEYGPLYTETQTPPAWSNFDFTGWKIVVGPVNSISGGNGAYLITSLGYNYVNKVSDKAVFLRYPNPSEIDNGSWERVTALDTINGLQFDVTVSMTDSYQLPNVPLRITCSNDTPDFTVKFEDITTGTPAPLATPIPNSVVGDILYLHRVSYDFEQIYNDGFLIRIKSVLDGDLICEVVDNTIGELDSGSIFGGIIADNINTDSVVFSKPDSANNNIETIKGELLALNHEAIVATSTGSNLPLLDPVNTVSTTTQNTRYVTSYDASAIYSMELDSPVTGFSNAIEREFVLLPRTAKHVVDIASNSHIFSLSNIVDIKETSDGRVSINTKKSTPAKLTIGGAASKTETHVTGKATIVNGLYEVPTSSVDGFVAGQWVDVQMNNVDIRTITSDGIQDNVAIRPVSSSPKCYVYVERETVTDASGTVSFFKNNDTVSRIILDTPLGDNFNYITLTENNSTQRLDIVGVNTDDGAGKYYGFDVIGYNGKHEIKTLSPNSLLFHENAYIDKGNRVLIKSDLFPNNSSGEYVIEGINVPVNIDFINTKIAMFHAEFASVTYTVYRIYTTDPSYRTAMENINSGDYIVIDGDFQDVFWMNWSTNYIDIYTSNYIDNTGRTDVTKDFSLRQLIRYTITKPDAVLETSSLTNGSLVVVDDNNYYKTLRLADVTTDALCFTHADAESFTPEYGVKISAHNKLNFPKEAYSDIAVSYFEGIVKMANDTLNEYQAIGSKIELLPSSLKSIDIDMTVKVYDTRESNKTLQGVRGLVTRLVNAHSLGEDIQLSSIAATLKREISNVKVVEVNSINDIIAVAPFEKPYVHDVNLKIRIV